MKLFDYVYSRRIVSLSDACPGDIYTVRGIWRGSAMLRPKVIGIVVNVYRTENGYSRLLLVSPFESAEPLCWSRKVSRACEYVNEGKALFCGRFNTSLILADGIEKNYETPAASFCFHVGKEGIRYLPALGELQKIRANLKAVNEGLRRVHAALIFQNGLYVSSSEKNAEMVWALDFASGRALAEAKHEQFRVRSVMNIAVSD